MPPSAKRFAALLQTGITAIANRTSKPKGVIRDELGLRNWAQRRECHRVLALRRWAYPQPTRRDRGLARVLVEAGRLDQSWLAAFLASAGYADSAQLVADFFSSRR